MSYYFFFFVTAIMTSQTKSTELSSAQFSAVKHPMRKVVVLLV